MGVVMSRCSLTGSIFKQTFLVRVYFLGPRMLWGWDDDDTLLPNSALV
jgi:hypothetical protein